MGHMTTNHEVDPTIVRLSMRADALRQLAALLEDRLVAHANWIEAATLRGDTAGALELATARRFIREEMFAKVNGAIMRHEGTISSPGEDG